MMGGKVYLVGAGPGQADLITRRGADLLSKADVVIYDRLVDPTLLSLAPRKARRVYAGKESDEKGAGQERIQRQMVREARAGKRVVRLKGGDPTLFGRASEEMAGLRQAAVPFEVVPGVSSVWAAAAAAGIPLTDRRLSHSVAIVTGHKAAGRKKTVRWEALARAADTLVILMGWATLPAALKALRKARPTATPVAVFRWVATPAEEKVIGTLGNIEEKLKRRPDFGPPVVVIVGQVVGLSRKNTGGPLAGKRIIVTRPAGDHQGLVRRLTELGAECLHLPAIAIRHRTLPLEEARALAREVQAADWIVFTSHHGVEALAAALRRRKKKFAEAVKGKICAIGPRTAQSAREAGREPDLMPDEFSKEGIERIFDRIPVKGKRVLIPRSNLGMGDRLAGRLRRRGARVRETVLYETLPVKLDPRRAARALKTADAVTFTSASTARVFLEALRNVRFRRRGGLNGAAAVAIGPATARALKAGGVRRCTLPKRSWTIDGLVEAIVEVCGD